MQPVTSGFHVQHMFQALAPPEWEKDGLAMILAPAGASAK
jgi:hypothetical protein